MDSSVSSKDEIWFLRVGHHISNTVYFMMIHPVVWWMGTVFNFTLIRQSEPKH